MDLQNVNLQTALHLAVERQHTQIVRVSSVLADAANATVQKLSNFIESNLTNICC
jgi:hypothetical protein